MKKALCTCITPVSVSYNAVERTVFVRKYLRQIIIWIMDIESNVADPDNSAPDPDPVWIWLSIEKFHSYF